MNDEINKALDLTPLPNRSVSEVILPDADNKIDMDYEYARGNLINIIEKGQQVLDGIMDVADMSQHPRGYEVAAKVIDSLTAANKNLLDLAKQKKDLDGSVGGPKTINNNLFVGSTAELQKLLKQQNE